MGRLGSIGRRFCANPGIFLACQTAIAGKPAPTGYVSITKVGFDTIPVGAGLLAKYDDAVYRQNSKVLDNITCRESPIDTKNRLAAEV